jgi:hypothetical protein
MTFVPLLISFSFRPVQFPQLADFVAKVVDAFWEQ